MNKVLLRFTATWCQPCKELSKKLDELDTSNYEIQVFDADANIEVFKEFKVRGVPTLILTENGEEVRRITGMHSTDELKDFLKG